jgi:hypothetical protein
MACQVQWVRHFMSRSRLESKYASLWSAPSRVWGMAGAGGSARPASG